jgi:hypothetical protein
LVFWLAVLAVLLSLRPWQWWAASSGLRWRRNGKAAWAPGSLDGAWPSGWRPRDVAAAAAAAGGLLLLLLLAAGAAGRGAGGAAAGARGAGALATPAALSARAEPGEQTDPRDIVVTTTTVVKHAHTSVMRTLYLDSIFVSLASYRCAARPSAMS